MRDFEWLTGFCGGVGWGEQISAASTKLFPYDMIIIIIIVIRTFICYILCACALTVYNVRMCVYVCVCVCVCVFECVQCENHRVRNGSRRWLVVAAAEAAVVRG